MGASVGATEEYTGVEEAATTLAGVADPPRKTLESSLELAVAAATWELTSTAAGVADAAAAETTPEEPSPVSTS